MRLSGSLLRLAGAAQIESLCREADPVLRTARVQVSEERTYFHTSHLSTLTMSHLRPLLSLTEGPFPCCGLDWGFQYSHWTDFCTSYCCVPLHNHLSTLCLGRMSPFVDCSAPCQGCPLGGYGSLLSMCYHSVLEADKFFLGALVGIPQASANAACSAQSACALNPLRVYDAPHSQSGTCQSWFARFIFSVTWTCPVCRFTAMERQAR